MPAMLIKNDEIAFIISIFISVPGISNFQCFQDCFLRLKTLKKSSSKTIPRDSTALWAGLPDSNTEIQTINQFLSRNQCFFYKN